MKRKEPNIGAIPTSKDPAVNAIKQALYELRDFMRELAAEQGGLPASRINKDAIPWATVKKAGSSLKDIEDRSHNSTLLDVDQSDDTNSSTVGGKHVTNAQVKKYEDHRLITNANPHGTNWDQIEETATYIPFDTTPTGVPASTPGVLSWNSVDGTFDMQLNGGSTLQAGQELHFHVKASGAIANGELCQFASVEGDHIKAKKAVASEIIAAPHYMIGVATQAIANNAFGYVTWFGKVNGVYTKTPANGDSVDWVAGDILYFDNTTGQLTKTAPDSPKIRIIVAAVVKEQTGAAENGIIIVRPSFGINFTDCDDVDGTPTNHGDFYTWNDTLGYFEPGRKIGDGTNYTEFETDGTLHMVGNATVWRDDNFAGVALGVGASPPDLIALNGGTLYVRAFDGNATVEQLFGATEIQHDYKEGSDIVVHIHWSPTTANAGNVKWQLSYQWLNIDGTFSSDTTISVTQAAGGTAWKANKISFAAISGTGKTIGSQFICRLFRDPTDAADTYPDDAAITGTFGIHYELDTIGSRQATTK